jgi:NADH-ubiquinone oxidoreductase chain 6
MAIGLILLLQSIIISVTTGILLKTFWFSYVLFLVFVGGILVLFIYVTSLASNEIFNFSIKIFFFFILGFRILNLIFFLFDKRFNLMNFESIDRIASNFSTKRFHQENILFINKLYNFPINFITIILIIYLFLTLVAVVKITNIFEGPLRPKLN